MFQKMMSGFLRKICLGAPNTSSAQPSLEQSYNFFDGPIAIFWDIENCAVPKKVKPEDVAENIRTALQFHPAIRGAVTVFSAYGKFSVIPRRVREGCQKSGINLIDVPSVKKDAADFAILANVVDFTQKYSPPASIMLISGDGDFAATLHVLGLSGYNVILCFPSQTSVSSELSTAGTFIWDWTSLASGKGILQAVRAGRFIYDWTSLASGEGISQAAISLGSSGGSTEISSSHKGCFVGDKSERKNKEVIVNRGTSQNCNNFGDNLKKSPSECSSASASIPSGLNQVSVEPLSSCEQTNLAAQPKPFNDLKAQFIYMLELSGGRLAASRVNDEYKTCFGRSLHETQYGGFRLSDLQKEIGDQISISRRFIYLRDSIATSTAPPSVLERIDEKGNESCEDGADVASGSANKSSVNERVGKKEPDDQCLEQFKHELQGILVGGNNLGELLGKLQDVVALQQQMAVGPSNKFNSRKIIIENPG